MLTLEYIQNNSTTVSKQFASDMMEAANNGNVNYFRETYDKLSDKNLEDLYLPFDDHTYLSEKLYNKNSLSEIMLKLLDKAMENYDESILDYILKESKIFINYKLDFSFYLREHLIKCIDMNMFDFAKRIF